METRKLRVLISQPIPASALDRLRGMAEEEDEVLVGTEKVS